MALQFSSGSTQSMTESANLLNDSSNQASSIYHEMEMSEAIKVETKDSQECFTLTGRSKYVMAAIVASLGGVLFGYDLGIVSGAILQLKEDFNLDCQQQEMVVSSMLFGALMGSLTGGYIIDYVGRRKTIIINAMVFFVGALILAFSPSYAMLIIGRLIVGFGTSLSAISECIYIAEISPPKKRGFLVCVNEIGITSGLMLAYLVNYIFIHTDNGWRYMFGISGIPALIQGFGIIFLPPSPRWLVCKGQDAKALKVIRTLNHGNQPEEEIAKIKDALNVESNYNLCYLFSRHQNMRDRMFVGLGVVFFQQFTGQPSVLYYAPSIFENIGFHSSGATLATVGIGLMKFLATATTLILVDKSGRRRFLLIGAIMMTICISILYTVTQCFPSKYHKELCETTRTPFHKPRLTNLSLSPSFTHQGTQSLSCTPILLRISQVNSPAISSKMYGPTSVRTSSTVRVFSSTTSSHDRIHVRLECSSPPLPASMTANVSTNQSKPTSSHEEEMPNVVKYVTVLSLMAFTGAYSCGYGPVSWLILSEIFPTQIKGRAFAATTVLNWGSNLVVSLTMLDLIDSVGVSWTFFIYGVIGFLAVIFIYKFVPETKNRSLEEINALFSTRNSFLEKCSCCSSCSCFPGHYSSVTSNTQQHTGLLEDDDWET